MKAVNLIPADGRGGAGRPSSGRLSPAHPVLALLAVAVAFVTVYVLSTNTISQRKASVAMLQAQAAEAQSEATRLSSYIQFEKLAQTRAQTVREIAATRFDWRAALSDLSRVVPADTSLQSLLGTVAPGASLSGAGGTTGASTSGLRGVVSAPAFEMKGCTSTHDDVARLMSRLRLVNGVTRVTLADSQKSDAQSAAPAGSVASASSTVGCGLNRPSFDLVVFFQPLPGAGPAGVNSVTPQQVSNTTTSGGSR
jgi:Tfp pilus assembly protein PilN